MSVVNAGAAMALASGGEPSPENGAKKKLGWAFWISVVWLTLVILAAIFANLLPLSNPNTSLEFPANLGPSLHHLLGTDTNGRDNLSRLIFGARVSLVVGFGSTAIALILGGAFGLISGYYGKKVDFITNSVFLIPLAFPTIVILLAAVTFLGHSLQVITITIGVVGAPLVFRIVRAATQSYAQREFVQAARALGARTSRIIFREVLPNVAMTTLSFVFIAVGVAILAEAILSFLGVSVPPPTATWGNMINVGADALEQNSTLWLWPSLAILFTVLALNVAGDKLRVYFGVKDSFL